MTSTYVDAEALAKKSGSAPPDSVASTCPPWTVSVTVKSKVDYWPKGDVRVWLFLVDGDCSFSDKHTRMDGTVSPAVTFEGHGPQRYKARTSTGDERWTFAEEAIAVTKDTAVQLVIEPQKWVAFNVVDQATNRRVAGAKLKVELGADAKPGLVECSDSVDTRNDEMFFLPKNDSSKLTELSHVDAVWEVVSVTSK